MLLKCTTISYFFVKHFQTNTHVEVPWFMNRYIILHLQDDYNVGMRRTPVALFEKLYKPVKLC